MLSKSISLTLGQLIQSLSPCSGTAPPVYGFCYPNRRFGQNLTFTKGSLDSVRDNISVFNQKGQTKENKDLTKQKHRRSYPASEPFSEIKPIKKGAVNTERRSIRRVLSICTRCAVRKTTICLSVQPIVIAVSCPFLP